MTHSLRGKCHGQYLLSIFFQESSSDHNSLYFTCSLINLCYSCVSVVSLSRHVSYITHTTKDLDTLMKEIKVLFRKISHTMKKLGGRFIEMEFSILKLENYISRTLKTFFSHPPCRGCLKGSQFRTQLSFLQAPQRQERPRS